MLKLEGSYTISAPRDTVWRSLLDPQILARALPGCEGVEATSDHSHQITMKVGVGPVKGTYRGRVQILEAVPPERYHLKVEGRGSVGFLEGEGTLILAEQDPNATIVHYAGGVEVGGAVAGVGQRLLQGAARQIISRSFDALQREIQSSPVPVAPATPQEPADSAGQPSTVSPEPSGDASAQAPEEVSRPDAHVVDEPSRG